MVASTVSGVSPAVTSPTWAESMVRQNPLKEERPTCFSRGPSWAQASSPPPGAASKYPFRKSSFWASAPEPEPPEPEPLDPEPEPLDPEPEALGLEPAEPVPDAVA
jgi:hypothetical protein